tara:strand:+ start:589 stop:1332 length:744 start_codon:yes stop_codon:yes gene_type:complete
MGVNINGKEIASLVRCAEAGLNQTEAAEATFLSKTTVHRASVQFGIKFHTYRDNENGRQRRSRTSNPSPKTASGFNDRAQREKKPIQSEDAIRGNLSPLEYGRKEIRRKKALEELSKAKTNSEKHEIAYGWNVLEHEIEMARKNKRPKLPMNLKEESSIETRDLIRQKERIAAENKRKIILSCFLKDEELTAADVGAKLNMDAIGMNVPTISSFMDGMAKNGRLSRYRLSFNKKGKNYWHYYLPKED